MASLEDFAAALGPLTSWQREILSLSAEDPGRTWRLALHTGRANGRSAAGVASLAAELAGTGHMHKYSAFGAWCITMTALGVPLWEQLTPGPEPAFTASSSGYACSAPMTYDPPTDAEYARGGWHQLGADLGLPTGPGEPAERDVIAEIDAVLADWADWENGGDAYRGGG
jgi:hypothetical protein